MICLTGPFIRCGSRTVWWSFGCYWIYCLIILHFGKKKRRKTFVINNYVRNYQSRLAIRGTGIPRAFALIKCFACSLWFNDAVWKAALSMFCETERPWELASGVNKTSVSRFSAPWDRKPTTVWYRKDTAQDMCKAQDMMKAPAALDVWHTLTFTALINTSQAQWPAYEATLRLKTATFIQICE